MSRFTLSAALAALLVARAAAQPPDPIPLPLPLPAPPAVPLKAPKDVPQPTPQELATLAQTLRTVALTQLPDPLIAASDGWGKQKEFVEGRVMLRSARKFAPEVPRVLLNDGLWQRVTVTARDPNRTLAVAVPELVRHDANTSTIVLDSAMDINFRVEHQLWVRGRRLYSGETRGHCRAGLRVRAEAVTRTVPVPGSFIPQVTLTLKITDAKLSYGNLIVDHTAGLDGPDAQAAAGLVLDLAKKVKPDLEAQLLAKADAAILKAVGNKEIKLQLDKLLTKPGPARK